MIRRPAWEPLPPPPGQDPAAARDFQNLAAEHYAGWDAALDAHGRTLAHASAALHSAQGETAASGLALAAAAGGSGSMLEALDSFELGPYVSAASSLLDGVQSGVGSAEAAVGAIPDANFTVGNFPSDPVFSLPSQLPTLSAPASPTQPVEQALWKVTLATTILKIPLGVPGASAAFGAPPTLGGLLPASVAGILPIISGFALGAALPLVILDLLGVNLAGGPTQADIVSMEHDIARPIDQAVQYIEGAAWMFKPPWSKPLKPGFIEYDYIYGMLRNQTCFALAVRDYWNVNFIAAQLTKLAQAWTKCTGQYPPEVECANWPH